MARYVDGFLLPVAKRKLAAYRKLARLGAKIWREHGALEYRECVGDDLACGGTRDFPRAAKARRGETVLFSWIVYRSRKDRDRIMAAVMKDPRLAKAMRGKDMPFDYKRMAYGGFEVLVEA